MNAEGTEAGPIDSDAVWSRRSEVLFRELEGEMVLYVPSTDGVVTLDAIGTAVWQVLEIPGPLSELVPVLAEAFEADAAAVERDVAALLAELNGLGVVETN